MDREDQFIIGGLTRPLLFLWLASILLEKKKGKGNPESVHIAEKKREHLATMEEKVVTEARHDRGHAAGLL